MGKAIYFLMLCTASMQAQTALTNKRVFEKPCPAVWPAVIRVMVENDFQPTATDKDAGFATFTFGKTLNGADIDSYVIVPKWMGAPGSKLREMILNGRPLRIGSATLLLAESEGKCAVTTKITGYTVLAGGTSWEPLESNLAFETRLLDQIGGK
jgi:hypothetical protein